MGGSIASLTRRPGGALDWIVSCSFVPLFISHHHDSRYAKGFPNLDRLLESRDRLSSVRLFVVKYRSGSYSNLPATPIRRDTVMVQNEGYAVVRFRADNPGLYIRTEFNCSTDEDRYLAFPLPHRVAR